MNKLYGEIIGENEVSRTSIAMKLEQRATEITARIKPSRVFVALIGLDGSITEHNGNKIVYTDIEHFKTVKGIKVNDTLLVIEYV